MLLYMIDLFGTAIFAVSGVLLAGRLKMDPFGVIVLGSVTAIGGGTIRDMALGATPSLDYRYHLSLGYLHHLFVNYDLGSQTKTVSLVGFTRV